MKVVNLGENPSVLNNFIAEMRDATIQKDRLRFRTNLERVGEIFAYELSKELTYTEKDVVTPLGIARVATSDTALVISTILRAGLPLQKGVFNFFDHAETAFLAAFRKYGAGDYFEIRADYCTTPSLEGKTLILADTMLATGSSIEVAIDKLIQEGGNPIAIHAPSPAPTPWTISPSSMATKSPSGWPPSTRNSPATATSSPASATPATSPSVTSCKDYPQHSLLECKTPRFTLFLCSQSTISAKRPILHLSSLSRPK